MSHYIRQAENCITHLFFYALKNM